MHLSFIISITIYKSIKNIHFIYPYYINHYPQKKLNGNTCGQIRKECFGQNEFTQYPIIPAIKYVRYWNEVELKKKHQKKMIIEEIKKQPKPNWNRLLIDEIFKYFPCLLDLGYIKIIKTV